MCISWLVCLIKPVKRWKRVRKWFLCQLWCSLNIWILIDVIDLTLNFSFCLGSADTAHQSDCTDDMMLFSVAMTLTWLKHGEFKLFKRVTLNSLCLFSLQVRLHMMCANHPNIVQILEVYANSVQFPHESSPRWGAQSVFVGFSESLVIKERI